MELLEKIKNVFSVDGKYNRLQYLLYGIVIPVILVMGLKIDFPSIVKIIIGLLALYLMIIAAIKRARDTKYDTTTLVVLGFIPYIGLIAQLFLLFAPHGEKSSKGSNKLIIILIAVFAIVILGILAAVAIPKIQKTNQAAQIEQTQLK